MTSIERMKKATELAENLKRPEGSSFDFIDAMAALCNEYFNEALGKHVAFETPFILIHLENFTERYRKEVESDPKMNSLYEFLKSNISSNHQTITMPNMFRQRGDGNDKR